MKVPHSILVFIVLVLPFEVTAQEDEVDSLKNTSFAIYPAFGFQPETSAQVGAIAIWVFQDKTTSDREFDRPTSVSPFLLYTFKNQVISAIDFDGFFKNGMNLEAVSRYFNFPDSYYGIGNSNKPDSLEKYTNRFIQLQGQLFKPINSRVFLGGSFELQRNWLREIVPEGRLLAENPTGLNGGFFFGLGPAAKYDSRNNTIYPSRGILASAEILVVRMGNFQYTNYNVDFRKFIPLGNIRNILGVHFSSRMTSGNKVPFYKLPQLGGDERLRGIENASLYRDRQTVFLQTEYRRDLFWRLGMVLFAGVGDVAAHIGDFRMKDFKYVAGIGGRFAAIKNQKLNIRGDIGFARGGQMAIYIGLREVF